MDDAAATAFLCSKHAPSSPCEQPSGRRLKQIVSVSASRPRRHDRNAARSAGRGEGYQGKEGLLAVLPASFTSSINCPLRMDWRIRLNDVPVGVGRPSDAN